MAHDEKPVGLVVDTLLGCNVPRAYDGDGAGRLGSKYIRWDAKPSVASEGETLPPGPVLGRPVPL
jgi:hypothetical protein